MNPEQIAKAGTEHAHQAALFCWAQQNQAKYPQLATMFAIPNGGARDGRTAARLKVEGVKAGVPDIFLPYPSKQYHGLFIELKRPKSDKKSVGRVDTVQKVWHDYLNENNYLTVVCYGYEQAVELIQVYFSG